MHRNGFAAQLLMRSGAALATLPVRSVALSATATRSHLSASCYTTPAPSMMMMRHVPLVSMLHLSSSPCAATGTATATAAIVTSRAHGSSFFNRGSASRGFGHQRTKYSGLFRRIKHVPGKQRRHAKFHFRVGASRMMKGG